jgi:hypothetical protein
LLLPPDLDPLLLLELLPLFLPPLLELPLDLPLFVSFFVGMISFLLDKYAACDPLGRNSITASAKMGRCSPAYTKIAIFRDFLAPAGVRLGT